MVKPRPQVDAMTLYTPGRSLEDARQASGRKEMVKLASNESLWGPSPSVITAIQEALPHLQYYPAVQEPRLREVLAIRHGLKPGQIVMGNGADEMLRLVAAAFVSVGDEVLYPAPSFSAYRHSTLLAGGVPKEVPLAGNGANDLEAMCRAITERTRVVYLCSPNNPTGTPVTLEAWQRYLAEVPEHVVTVVDAAYEEFVAGPEMPDFLGAVRQDRAIVVVRTFSKLYALAGLRTGWATAPEWLMPALLKVREPFSLNSLGAVAAEAALKDSDYYGRVRQETLEARAFLLDALSQRGHQFFESQANFVTAALPVGVSDVPNRLMAEGFVVRPTDAFGLPQHIRVTVAPQPILEEFLTAFDRVLAQ